MSSSDRRNGASNLPTRRAALGFVAILGVLAGCTVQPVYMPVAGNRYTTADLSMVTVEGVGTRVGQEVRNNLVFAFTGGRKAPEPKYVLAIQVASNEERLGFEKDETAPSYQVLVEVKFELKAIADGRPLLRSVSIGRASYDRSNQNFANVRARIDAENRAAQAVADEIQLRLAIAIAQDKPPAPVTAPARPDLPAGAVPAILSNTQ